MGPRPLFIWWLERQARIEWLARAWCSLWHLVRGRYLLSSGETKMGPPRTVWKILIPQGKTLYLLSKKLAKERQETVQSFVCSSLERGPSSMATPVNPLDPNGMIATRCCHPAVHHPLATTIQLSLALAEERLAKKGHVCNLPNCNEEVHSIDRSCFHMKHDKRNTPSLRPAYSKLL